MNLLIYQATTMYEAPCQAVGIQQLTEFTMPKFYIRSSLRSVFSP